MIKPSFAERLFAFSLVFFIASVLYFGLTTFVFAFSVDTSSNTTSTGGPTISWSHTVDGDLLVVGIGVSSSNPTGACTYNSDAMTSFGGAYDGSKYVQGFYLINPDQGSHTIACDMGYNFMKIGVATSYDDMPVGFSAKTPNGNNSGGNVVITTVDENALVVGAASKGSSVSAGTNTTARTMTGDGGNEIYTALLDMGSYPTTAGTYTLASNGGEIRGISFGYTAPILGCTDPLAENYDPVAEEDDGSCTYPYVAPPITEPFTTDANFWTVVLSLFCAFLLMTTLKIMKYVLGEW